MGERAAEADPTCPPADELAVRVRALADSWSAAFPNDTAAGIHVRAFAYQLRELLDTIPAPTVDDDGCPNDHGADGIIACWSPGGPCPEGRTICETCGPCNHCIPAPTEPTGEREALVAAVLAEHWDCITNCDIKTDGVRDGQMWYFIHWSCGMSSGPVALSSKRLSDDHRTHVAAVVVAALSPTPHDGTEAERTKRCATACNCCEIPTQHDGTEGGGDRG